MSFFRIETLLTHKNRTVRDLTRKLLTLTLEDEVQIKNIQRRENLEIIFFCKEDPIFTYSVYFMKHAMYLEILDDREIKRPKGFKGLGTKLNEGEKIVEALLRYTPVKRT